MPYLVGRRMGLVSRSVVGDGPISAMPGMIRAPIGQRYYTGPVVDSGAGGNLVLAKGGPFTYTPPGTGPSPNPPVGPVYAPTGPPVTSAPDLPISSANAGTPVPAGYPTSQIFVDPSGAFWEYSASQNQWKNVGTPYNTGAAAIPPAAPTGSTPSAPTSLVAPTTAPAPISTVVSTTATSAYDDLLNWLQEDTLGATIGFSSIPNWIIAAGALALAWKFSQSGGRKRNPSRRRAQHRSQKGRR